MNTTTNAVQVISPSQLLHHWQQHRDLTRRVIAAFPEKELFTYSIGGMRTFAAIAMELIGIEGPGVEEIVTGLVKPLNEDFEELTTKEQLLDLWDQMTIVIDTFMPQIPLDRFQEKITVFGKYGGTVSSTIFYFIDNEIHHRGQGYVYLRSLGIEPPFFWDRK